MMKRLLYTALATTLFAACTGSAELPSVPGGNTGTENTDSLLDVEFSLLVANEGRASAQAPSSALASGTLFRAYAYKQGASPTGNTPQASSVYTVQADGTATGNLKLYRGNYDFYLVSYNTGTTPPAVASNTDPTLTVGNGYDFMQTALKNVTVQPQAAGTATLTIPVGEPFVRLGSQVVMEVKPNDRQPVSIRDIHVNYIKLKQLSTARNYTLGSTVWNTADNPEFTQELEYKAALFTRDDADYYNPWTSSPQVVLPVDATTDLTFEVNLKVDYGTTSSPLSGDFTYQPTIRKPLIAGMTYKFEFTLTFYGIMTPADLTLAVREYNKVNIDTDNIGGEQ